jgi:hypothetical protein
MIFKYKKISRIILNYQCGSINYMLENLEIWLYAMLGFAATYVGLELAWHFTACRVKEATLKPCVFKQAKMAVARIK